MSSTTTSGRSAPMARRTAARPRSAKLCRVAVRSTSMPSSDVRGAPPGQPEQTRRTRWPRAAIREKISNRWISAPPACGFSRSCQLTTSTFTARSQAPERARDPVQYTVHEPRRPRAAEPVRQPDRLVDGYLGRHVAPAELQDAEPEDVPLD